MIRLILILLFLFFTSNAYSFGIVEQASHCDDMSEKIESEWFVDNESDYIPHVINRTKRKDIEFESIDFKTPQYSGIKIKTKKNSYPILNAKASFFKFLTIDKVSLKLLLSKAIIIFFKFIFLNLFYYEIFFQS